MALASYSWPSEYTKIATPHAKGALSARRLRHLDKGNFMTAIASTDASSSNGAVSRRVFLIDADGADIRGQLACYGREYTVATAASAGQALDAIAAQPAFDVVLLGKHLPDMDGLELVRRLSEIDAARDAAIVLLAEQDSVEDRLAAYEAGASDFLIKPLSAEGLHHKISLLLGQRDAMAQAKLHASTASYVAMAAMGELASLGRIIQLFRGLFGVKILEDIPPLVFDALAELGMDCVLQLRKDEQVANRSSAGECNEMELGLLDTISQYGERLYSFRAQSALSYEHVTLVAKNMPKNDPLAYGRLKDYLAIVAEGIDERVRTL